MGGWEGKREESERLFNKVERGMQGWEERREGGTKEGRKNKGKEGTGWRRKKKVDEGEEKSTKL